MHKFFSTKIQSGPSCFEPQCKSEAKCLVFAMKIRFGPPFHNVTESENGPVELSFQKLDFGDKLSLNIWFYDPCCQFWLLLPKVESQCWSTASLFVHWDGGSIP